MLYMQLFSSSLYFYFECGSICVHLYLSLKIIQAVDFWQVSLLGQISIRSDTFLEGLETTHILRNVVSEACSSVNDLRKSMMRIDNEVVKKAIHVPQLAQKQQVKIFLYSLFQMIREFLTESHNQSPTKFTVRFRLVEIAFYKFST